MHTGYDQFTCQHPPEIGGDAVPGNEEEDKTKTAYQPDEILDESGSRMTQSI